MLRATIAVCEVGPPRSVKKAAKRPPRKRNMSAGEMSRATTISGSVELSDCRMGNRDIEPDSTRNNLSRSEEHTSELQSLMRNSYAVYCLTNKKQILTNQTNYQNK